MRNIFLNILILFLLSACGTAVSAPIATATTPPPTITFTPTPEPQQGITPKLASGDYFGKFEEPNAAEIRNGKTAKLTVDSDGVAHIFDLTNGEEYLDENGNPDWYEAFGFSQDDPASQDFTERLIPNAVSSLQKNTYGGAVEMVASEDGQLWFAARDLQGDALWWQPKSDERIIYPMLLNKDTWELDQDTLPGKFVVVSGAQKAEARFAGTHSVWVRGRIGAGEEVLFREVYNPLTEKWLVNETVTNSEEYVQLSWKAMIEEIESSAATSSPPIEPENKSGTWVAEYDGIPYSYHSKDGTWKSEMISTDVQKAWQEAIGVGYEVTETGEVIDKTDPANPVTLPGFRIHENGLAERMYLYEDDPNFTVSYKVTDLSRKDDAGNSIKGINFVGMGWTWNKGQFVRKIFKGYELYGVEEMKAFLTNPLLVAVSAKGWDAKALKNRIMFPYKPIGPATETAQFYWQGPRGEVSQICWINYLYATDVPIYIDGVLQRIPSSPYIIRDAHRDFEKGGNTVFIYVGLDGERSVRFGDGNNVIDGTTDNANLNEDIW